MKKRFNAATVVGLIVLVAALTFTLTYSAVTAAFSEQLSIERATSKRLSKIVNMVDVIESEFVGDYEFEELLNGAAEGIIAATGDRWSFYMDEEEYQQYKASTSNDYVGIGITVVFDEDAGGLRVAKVHAGSPADEAGLKFRDLIVTVDGQSILTMIEDLGYEEAVNQIRGESGTTVVLGVSGDNGEVVSHVVTRGAYVNNPISSEILEGNIGYIRIENFDSRADVNFISALNSLIEAGVEGLIFDVRSNGGGYKDVMVEMLDVLCPEGVLFTMRDKSGNEQVDYSDAQEVNLPMAVLVNEGSYSAAEFFAAALQEYGKAFVVGTGTSGKGYSQVTIELGDGSAMNISTNEYFTPSGKSLIGEGIKPDYPVAGNSSVNLLLLSHEDDTQLQTAIEQLKLKMPQQTDTDEN